MSELNKFFNEEIIWKPLAKEKPRPGHGVLLSNLKDPYCVFAMWHKENGFWVKCDEPWKSIKFNPTHWAHLPFGVYNLYQDQKVYK